MIYSKLTSDIVDGETNSTAELENSLLNVVIEELSDSNEIEEAGVDSGASSGNRNEEMEFLTDLLQSALERRKRRRRIRRDAEPEPDSTKSNTREKFDKVVESALRGGFN